MPQVYKAAFPLKVVHLDRKELNKEAPTNYMIK